METLLTIDAALSNAQRLKEVGGRPEDISKHLLIDFAMIKQRAALSADIATVREVDHLIIITTLLGTFK